MLSSTVTTETITKPVICVFCGASSGSSPLHLEAARSLAKTLHTNNISLVYGGGTTGIMGELARTLVFLSGPASVHGIIPDHLVKLERPEPSIEVSTKPSTKTWLDREGEYTYGRTTIVADMQTRKQMMIQFVMDGGPGSGFIALSGGYGTLEELMEVVTWQQLGIHDKGIIVFNVEGFWDDLLKWENKATKEGLIKYKYDNFIAKAESADEAVSILKKPKVYGENIR